MIRIDEDSFYNNFSPYLFEKLIDLHKKSVKNYDLLNRYYTGNHNIKNRKRSDPTLPNNIITANFAKYITDMAVGFFIGNPVVYTANCDIKAVTDKFYAQGIARIDTQLAKNLSVCGDAYELVYADSDAEPKSICLNPKNTFIVYDDTVERKKLCAVNYFVKENILTDSRNCVVRVYTKDMIYTFQSNTSEAKNLVLISEEPHYFGGVPVIYYVNNPECQGDFEQVISLIDAYNLLQSDRINDKEQFVNSFLLLLGIELDSSQAEELKKEKILLGDIGGDAKYLSKTLSETDTEILRKTLVDDIHKLSFVPDLTDDKFGGNITGVAIKYKIIAFNQLAKNKEQYFAGGLMERFGLYNYFLNIKSNVPIIPHTEIECVFKRNLPVNEYELSQTAVNLKGLVSDETLIAQFPFVTDAHEEYEIVKKQRAEENRSLTGLGGFGE